MESTQSPIMMPEASDRPGANDIRRPLPVKKAEEEVAPMPASTGRAAAGTSTNRTASRMSSPQNRYTSSSPRKTSATSDSQRSSEPSFIGPMGYELK